MKSGASHVVVALVAAGVGWAGSAVFIAASPRSRPGSQAVTSALVCPVDPRLVEREKLLKTICENGELFGRAEHNSKMCDQCVESAMAWLLPAIKNGFLMGGDCKNDHHVGCEDKNGKQDCICWAKSMMADNQGCQAGTIVEGIQELPCVAACELAVIK